MHVILDLGCVKPVAGTAWMNEVVKEWKQRGRWLRVFPEQEVFQFGNGQSLRSKYQVQVEAALAGCQVVLGFSVVSGECPPLLSRHACSQLSMMIDCGQHTMSSTRMTRMKVKAFGLSRASNGHYTMNIDQFDGVACAQLEADFCTPEGHEAYVVETAEAVMLDHVQAPRHSTTSPSTCAAHVQQCIDSQGRLGGGCSNNASCAENKATALANVQSSRRWRRKRTCWWAFPARNFCTSAQGQIRSHGSEEASCNACEAFQAGAGGGAGRRGGAERRLVGGGCGRAEQGRTEHDPQAPREDPGGQEQEGQSDGPDRIRSGPPQPVHDMECGDGLEPGRVCEISHEDVPLEEVPMADASEAGSGEGGGGPMEEEPALAGHAVREGGGIAMGTLRGTSTKDQQQGDLEALPLKLLQRGDAQRLKQGAQQAKERAALIQNTAKTEERYVVLEISAGMARLSEEAIDLLYGHDLRQNDTQKRVFDIIHERKPDLVTLSMPCGPWCSWMRLAPEEKLDELRAEHLTLWRFARKVWDKQVSEGPD